MGNAKSSGARRRNTIIATIGEQRSESVIGNATTTMLTTKVSLDDFDLLSVIGRGSYGKVYQVRHKESGEIFALKSLKKEVLAKRGQIEHTKSERRILELIEHPFIISL
jgi:serine/threonine protein kinase